MDADELYTTTMCADNRQLIQLTTDNIEKTLELYNNLMGKTPSKRREFIMSHKLSKLEFNDSFEDEGDDE